MIIVFASLAMAVAQKEESKPILYLFLSDECVITQYYVPELNRLASKYAEELDIRAIFPNFSSKSEKIEAFYKKYELLIPYKTDYYKTLSRSLGATITPEAILLDVNGRIIYQGRIDNSYVQIGKRRRVITKHELEDALLSIINNKKVSNPRTEAIGCFINFNDKISSQR